MFHLFCIKINFNFLLNTSLAMAILLTLFSFGDEMATVNEDSLGKSGLSIQEARYFIGVKVEKQQNCFRSKSHSELNNVDSRKYVILHQTADTLLHGYVII